MALDADAIQPGCEVAHAWCQAHEQPEQAEAYAQRWRDRQAALDDRGEQAATLDNRRALLPAQLSADQHAPVLALLQGLNRRGIAAVYLARRVLPVDPHWPSHVLGVKLRTWARLGQQQPDIVNRLAALAWPGLAWPGRCRCWCAAWKASWPTMASAWRVWPTGACFESRRGVTRSAQYKRNPPIARSHINCAP